LQAETKDFRSKLGLKEKTNFNEGQEDRRENS
jgi:hypothetical protein